MNLNSQLGVSVDCGIFGYNGDAIKVLLIQQKALNGGPLQESGLQMVLPGDLDISEEALSECAARVLQELTSIEGVFHL